MIGSQAVFGQKIDKNTQNEIDEHLKIYEYLILEENNDQAALRLAKVAVIYWEKTVYDSALVYFNKAAGIFEQLNQLQALKSVYTNIGAIYSEQNMHKKAIDYYTKSLGLSIQTGNEKEIAIKRIDLANSYSLNKQHKMAIDLIDKVMAYAKSVNDQALVLSTYAQYASVYRRSGNEWKARENEFRHNHLNDSIEGVNYDLNAILAKERKKFVQDSLSKIVYSDDEKEIATTSSNKEERPSFTREDFVKSRKLEALQGMDSSLKSSEKSTDAYNEDSIYTEVDILPEFPGGEFGFRMFLANALTLSNEFIKHEKDSIIVEHIINKYGLTSDAKIMKGIHPELDNEVLNVMYKMPKWIPAKNNSANVSFLMKTMIPYPINDMQQVIEEELNNFLKNNESILSGNNSDSLQNYFVHLGNLHFYLKEYEKALEFYNKALIILEQDSSLLEKSNVLSNIGSIYHSWCRYKTAIDFYLQSLEIKNNIDDKKGAGKVLHAVGQVYLEMTDTVQALNYFEKSYVIDSVLGNKHDQAAALNNMGILFYSQKQLNEAYSYYMRALEIYNKTNNKYGSATTMNNIGNVEVEMQKYTKALNTYNQSIILKEEIKYYEGIAISYHNIGNVHLFLNNQDEAINYYNRSIELAKKYYLSEVEYKNYESLAEIFAQKDDCSNTLKYHKLYTKTRFFLNEEDKIEQISEHQVKYVYQEKLSGELMKKIDELQITNSLKDKQLSKYMEDLREEKLLARLESERNVQQIKLLHKEKIITQKDIARKKIQRNILIALLIIIIGVSTYIYLNFRQKKRLNLILVDQKKSILEKNKILHEQNEEIEAQRNLVFQQNELLEKKNSEITDSIHYANYIQSAILPGKEIRNELLRDHFIFFKPRDIVSGDFYWMTKVNNEIVFAVADCTGHGVPGAFMSMLGISFLNEIVNKEYITHTGVILRRLRKEVINALHQTGQEGQQRDGMDMAICTINFDDLKLQFSGANNPLYIIRQKNEAKIESDKIIENSTYTLYEIKGDKMPISIYERMDKYTDHEIQLVKGDCLYMFSDGYADQFSESGKKFKYKPFKDLLLNNTSKSMEEQKEILKTTLASWQGNFEQIDDVLVLGMRI